jgi:phosphoribosylglycinamide formyltransferase-1
MRAIVAAIASGDLAAEARVVISNNADAEALDFARRQGLAARHISKKSAGSEGAADREILAALEGAGVDLVVLSGYLRMVGPLTLGRYRNRILNVHPALLPKHGGKGMYGSFVHEAVLGAKDPVSGATIHLVDEEYDQGPVVSQKSVPVRPDDTVETLRARVMGIEGPLFVETLQAIVARGGEVLPRDG